MRNLAPFGAAILTGGCALLSVTPADRADAYRFKAKELHGECEVYNFDRAAGLVPDVPAMTEICK